MINIPNMNEIQLFICDIAQNYTTFLNKYVSVPYAGIEPKYMLHASSLYGG